MSDGSIVVINVILIIFAALFLYKSKSRHCMTWNHFVILWIYYEKKCNQNKWSLVVFFGDWDLFLWEELMVMVILRNLSNVKRSLLLNIGIFQRFSVLLISIQLHLIKINWIETHLADLKDFKLHLTSMFTKFNFIQQYLAEFSTQ